MVNFFNEKECVNVINFFIGKNAQFLGLKSSKFFLA